MKKMFFMAITLSSVLFISCDKNEETEVYKDDSAIFEESVMIKIKGSNGATNKSSEVTTTTVAREIELTNFNDDYELKPAYTFDGHVFNDDGKYNDLVSGDNIYTSVELFSETTSERNSQTIKYAVSEKFKYRNSNGVSNKISISCKFRRVPCQNTNFWDSDWGTGWGCVEFYDCTVTVSY